MERKRHRDGLILSRFVDVIIHSQFVVAQRCLIPPAVGQHPIALVGQPFVVQGRKGPEHALHERDVKGFVVVLEVHPACLAGDIGLPLVGVLQHRLARSLVEGGNTHFFDLTLIRDAQLPLGLQLGRQSVGVPTKTTVNLFSPHSVETGENVFGVPGQEVPVVG